MSSRTFSAKRAARQIGIFWTVFGYAIASRVAPRLAARRAARRWCRLPAGAGRRKDNRPAPGRLATIDIGGGRELVTETWGPDDGRLVYLVHGWGGWRGQVAAFAQPLADAGFRVLSFDCLSHGDSGPGEHGPRHSSGGEMAVSLAAIAQHCGQPYGIIGHSLGCATAARLLTEGLQTERLVLVAPNPDMGKVARQFGRRLKLSRHARLLLERESEAWAHRPMDDFTIANIGAAGARPAPLVIHDRDDKESPYRVAEQIVAAWPGASLMTTERLGHHRILVDPAVIAAAAAHIAA